MFQREEDQKRDDEKIAQRQDNMSRFSASAVELAEDDEYLIVLPR